MPPPPAPSRIEPLAFPVFGISWFAEPAQGGRSIVAYCGGGGSAKTGVKNSIVIFGEQGGPRQVSTGDYAGDSLRIYQNPLTGKLWMMVGLEKRIRRYPVDVDDENESESFEELEIGEKLVPLAVNSMASQFAVGCESGKILIYATSDDEFTRKKPLYVLSAHTNAVCALDYAARTEGRLLSSAKDGTACIWEDGRMIAGLRCSVAPDPKQRRPQQILVRGCAFGDMEGNVCYTVASGRRGKAFLAKWEECVGDDGEAVFVCASKNEISDCPISYMSLSTDLSLLVMGSVDGSVILWSVENWKTLKVYPQVHEFTVTAVAARPFYSIPGLLLQGEEEDGVMIHARSVSADNQLACLTLQRRAPRKHAAQNGDVEGAKCCSCSSFMTLIHRLLVFYIVCLILTPMYQEAREKCSHVWDFNKLEMLGECLLHDFLIAPISRPGVASRPY